MKRNSIILAVITAAVTITVGVFVIKHEKQSQLDVSSKQMEVTKMLMEYAYFEGQKDYLRGSIRIQVDADSNYTWGQTPWDNTERQPKYIPSLTLQSNIDMIVKSPE
jgi:hypothetical protein